LTTDPDARRAPALRFCVATDDGQLTTDAPAQSRGQKPLDTSGCHLLYITRKCQAHWWGSRTSNPVRGGEGRLGWVRFPCTSAILCKYSGILYNQKSPVFYYKTTTRSRLRGTLARSGRREITSPFGGISGYVLPPRESLPSLSLVNSKPASKKTPKRGLSFSSTLWLPELLVLVPTRRCFRSTTFGVLFHCPPPSPELLAMPEMTTSPPERVPGLHTPFFAPNTPINRNHFPRHPL
jgi:hypothetical protein